MRLYILHGMLTLWIPLGSFSKKNIQLFANCRQTKNAMGLQIACSIHVTKAFKIVRVVWFLASSCWNHASFYSIIFYYKPKIVGYHAIIGSVR